MIILALRYWRWIAAAALIAALVIGIPIAKHRYDAGQQKVGYDRRAAEDKAAAEAQTARNLDLQRQAELHYTVQREAQEKFITVTTKEVVHETAPLAACVLPDGAVRLLNSARECAAGDTPSACGSGDGVPGSPHP